MWSILLFLDLHDTVHNKDNNSNDSRISWQMQINTVLMQVSLCKRKCCGNWVWVEELTLLSLVGNDRKVFEMMEKLGRVPFFAQTTPAAVPQRPLVLKIVFIVDWISGFEQLLYRFSTSLDYSMPDQSSAENN